MRVRGDGSVASLVLHVVEPGTGAVVFDIDGTLTTSDGELTRELVAQLQGQGYVQRVRPGAAELARAWAARGYLPVYVTARPGVLRATTRRWLVEHGFPPGPLRLAYRTRDFLPSRVAAYKAALLGSLTAAGGLRIAAAYGNATTDVEAYRAAGIPRDRTFIVGPNAGRGGTVAVADYRALLPAVEAAPRAPVPAPPPIGW